MGPIVLAKNFTFVGADTSQAFLGDWIQVDPQFQNWNLHVHVQTMEPASPTTGISVSLRTSYDGVESEVLGNTTISATGSTSTAISAEMLGMVRLRLANLDSVAVFCIISVWLQPKSD